MLDGLCAAAIAGKYVPAFGYAIHEYNAQARAEGNPTIPLAGLGIGDGWSDPLNMYQQYPEIMVSICSTLQSLQHYLFCCTVPNGPCVCC